MLQRVRAVEGAGGVVELELDERRDFYGHLTVPTFLFCCDCFDTKLAEHVSQCSDVPPILVETAIIDCLACGFAILEDESFIVCRAVEIRPGAGLRGKHAHAFVEHDPEDGFLCLSCSSFMGELLKSSDLRAINEDGECELCVRDHCTRAGPCPCECHQRKHDNQNQEHPVDCLDGADLDSW
jgi:hypothetical protein